MKRIAVMLALLLTVLISPPCRAMAGSASAPLCTGTPKAHRPVRGRARWRWVHRLAIPIRDRQPDEADPDAKAVLGKLSLVAALGGALCWIIPGAFPLFYVLGPAAVLAGAVALLVGGAGANHARLKAVVGLLAGLALCAICFL